MDEDDLPKTFTDSAGRTWTVSIVWSTCKRIKDVAGLDINSLVSDGKKGKDPVSPFTQLMTDFEAMTSVLYAIFKPECDKLELPLTLDDFRDGINGNAVIDARNALAQAIHDFFPDPQRNMLGWAIKTGIATERKIAAMPDPAATVRAAMKDFMAHAPLTPRSGDAQESAESTPTPAPSAS
jgi:hypothetical protein